MRNALPLFALLAACAPNNYAYTFDLTDPGAKNLMKPGERDTLEDNDVKAEILVDPTSFQAILLDVTNKTDAMMQVAWDRILVVGPDGVQTPVKPDAALGQIEPAAKVVARLVPFQLPAQGAAAEAYKNARFELVVPMNVRGQWGERRYHMISMINKL